MPWKLPPSFPVLSLEEPPLALDGSRVVLTHVPDMPTATFQVVSQCVLVGVRMKAK